ncbi:PHP domain-containing protein [Oscillatoria sp. FACHB-1407]|uniref:PHP domain-containing protein n=1 Tax=Oscillatoria sp. FACHB-1407 TaxID=2692847 RepID=UPI001683DF56|nr:PHP domain-containing protein [Oscillatoria sp. FACHB-1407]MBD2459828.1 PHP domain-containing protein [Oscillatoria sp. FACHB-1407]
MLDLHAHTTYSDGRLTPSELVEAAAKAGIRALAITDHDTLAGWDEAIAAAATWGIEIVPGVELSTVHRDRSLHILGYYPNPDQLQAPLRERVEGRKRRAQQILDKLAALGYVVQMPFLGEGVAPSRPHIATAMVEAGYVKSSREAFDRFLGDHQPAYVHYEKFSIQEGISLLRSCGAIAIWAHPYLYRGGEIEEVLLELIEAGLQGVEVYHPNHTPSQRQTLEKWCQQYGLLMTGGSDYHGPAEFENQPSNTLNMLQLPMELLSPLKQAVYDLQ